MIPLRDNIPSQRFPFVNYSLIGINILLYVYMYWIVGDAQAEALMFDYGVVPRRVISWVLGADVGWDISLLPLVSYMFIHGGFLHVAGNCLYLYIFGDNVEDYFGHIGYVFFYLLAGIGSAFIHLAINWDSTMPTVGASGAIAGIMGAYFILYPHAKVVTIVPILIFIQIMEIPAVIFLGFWVFLQFISLGGQGVAWWAHIGGFFVGILLLQLYNRFFRFKPPRPPSGGPRKVIHIN